MRVSPQRALLMMALVMLCCSARVAWGYELESEDWDGLSDLRLLAQAQGITLVAHDTIDYASLSLEEPWLLLYPQEALRADQLSRYVVAGGRVILADDFGQSDALLARLELSRVMTSVGALPHDEFVGQNPALPILRPRGMHPMLRDVSMVVANHPAVLFNVGGAVLPYAQGGGLAYDMNLERGKVIAIADASLFINHMLEAGDNAQLVRNTLSYACAERSPCTVHVAAGQFAQRGRYGASALDGLGLGRDVIEDVDTLNQALAESMRKLPAGQLFYYLSLLLVAGLGVYLYTIFPWRRTRPYSEHLSQHARAQLAPQSEFDWNLARFGEGGVGVNYALPVSILKELFEELFMRALGVWPGGEARDEPQAQRLSVVELGALYAAKALRGLPPAEAAAQEREVVALLAQLARVPTRHRVFLESDVHLSERDMLRLHERCMQILERLGCREDYERRTRNDLR